MTPNPEPSLQVAYSPFPLVSLLGTPREAVKLSLDDVVRRSGPQLGSLSQTFTVAELFVMLRGVSWYLPKNVSINRLLAEGVDVKILKDSQVIEGKLKLDVGFYPGEEETIQFLTDESSEQPLAKPITLSELLSGLARIDTLTPRPQGFPVEVLQLGSSAWQKGMIWMTLKFYPASSEAGEMQSPLDEIRKLMADAS